MSMISLEQVREHIATHNNNVELSAADPEGLPLASFFAKTGLSQLIIRGATAESDPDRPGVSVIRGTCSLRGEPEGPAVLFISANDPLRVQFRVTLSTFSFAWFTATGMVDGYTLPVDTSGWEGLQAKFIFDSAQEVFIIELENSSGAFELFGGMRLENAGMRLIRSFTEKASQMELYGNYAIGGHPYRFALEIPVASNQRWKLELVHAPEGEAAVDTQVNGLKQLPLFPKDFGEIPAPLATLLSAVVVDTLELEFSNFSSPKGRFACSLVMPGVTELFSGCLLYTPALRMETGNLLGSAYHRLELSAVIAFGNEARAGFSAIVSNNDPWDFHFDADFSLKRFTPALLEPFGIDIKQFNLPENFFKLESITVTRFDLSFDPKEKRMQRVELELGADAWIEFIRGIRLGQPELMLDYQNEGSGHTVSGSFRAELKVGRTSFSGQAVKDETGWELSAGTGLVESFPLNQLIEDIAVIVGTEISAEPFKNIRIGRTSFTYHTAGSIDFECSTETTFPLPFNGWETNRIASFIAIGCKKKNAEWSFTWNFAAKIAAGGMELSVAAKKAEDGHHLLQGGWKAASAEDAINAEKLLRLFGITVDLSAVPAVLNPALSAFAYEYSEATSTLSVSAYTLAGAVMYFVAKKVGEAWKPVIGIDYHAAAPDPSVPAELNDALKKFDITQLQLLYAATDLENFLLPQPPEVPGSTPGKLRIANKRIDVKQGIFFALEATNIQLPSIGKLNANVEQFYIAIAKTDSVRAEVKGRIAMNVEGATAGILVKAAYESKTGALQFNGALETTMGLAAFAQALLPEGFALPESVELPDLRKMELSIDTGKQDYAFRLELLKERNALSVPGILSMQLDSLSVSYADQAFRFSLVNGSLRVPAFDAIAPTGVGGSLDLLISKAESWFSFTPNGFRISTPAIPYSETVSAGGTKDSAMTTVTREMKVTVAPGAFSVNRKDGKWSISASADFSFIDFPDPVRRVFMEEKNGTWISRPLTGKLTVDDTGASVELSGTLAQIVIPDLIAMLGITELPPIGDSAVALRKLKLSIGRDVEFTAGIGVALPAKLNEFLGFKENALFRTYRHGDEKSFFGLELTLGKSISGGMTGSPFVEMDFIREPDSKRIEIDFDKLFGREDLGAVTFIKPDLSLNLQAGTFRLHGGYELDPKRGLRLPLYPVKRLLETVKLGALAEQLPKSLPVKSMKATEVIDSLRTSLRGTGMNLPPAFADVLDTLAQVLDKLPTRFNEYLSVNIPQKLTFDLDISPDGGVCFSVETDKENPLQVLFPTPVAMAGLRLQKLAFGTAFGGSLLRVDVSAEVDVFDYFTLAAALLMPEDVAKKAGLPVRDAHRTFSARDLLILVVYQAGIPIPIPLFYTALDIDSYGIEGVKVRTSIGFPKPGLNVMKALKIVSDAKKFIVDNTDFDVRYPITLDDPEHEPGEMNLVFRAGPFYLELPPYLSGGKTPEERRIGVTRSYRLLDVLNTTGVLLNGIKHLVQERTPAYLIKAVPLDYRAGNFSAVLFSALQLKLAWLYSTASELEKIAAEKPHVFLGVQEAETLLARIRPPAAIRKAAERSTRVEEGAIAREDKTVILFVKGEAKLFDSFALSAKGGVVLADDGAATSIALHATLGPLRFDLDGIVVIHKTQPLLAGSTSFLLFGRQLFAASFEFGPEHFSVAAAVLPGQPVGGSFSARGVLRSDRVSLDGEMEVRFFFLTANATISLLAVDGPSHLRFNGTVSATDLFRLSFGFSSALLPGQARSHVSLEATALGLLGMRFEGEALHTENGLQLQAEGKVLVMGTVVASARLSLTPERLDFSTLVHLFPGLRIGGDVVITNTTLHFVGKGSFDFGPFSSSAELVLNATAATQQLRLELTNLFWPGMKTIFNVRSSAGNVFELDFETGAALKAFGGLLQISGNENPQLGPSGGLSLDREGLKKLYFDGAISIFGIRDSGTVRYGNKQFDIDYRKTWDNALFKGSSHFNAQLRPDYFSCSTSLHFELGLGTLIADLLQRWLGYRPNVSLLNTSFTLDNFSIVISRQGRPADQPDEYLRELERRTREEMEKAAQRAKDAARNADQQIVAIREAIAHLEAQRAHVTNPERIVHLVEELRKQEGLLREAGVQVETYFRARNDFSQELATAEREARATVDRINELSGLDYGVEKAASDWYHHHYSWRTYDPYGQAVKQLNEFTAREISPYNSEAAQWAGQFQHHMYWFFFDPFKKDFNRQTARGAMFKLQEVLHELNRRKSADAERWRGSSGEAQRLFNNAVDLSNAQIKTSDGVILLAYTEFGMGVSGKRLRDETIYADPPSNLVLLSASNAEENGGYQVTISGALSFTLAGHTFQMPKLAWTINLSNVNPDLPLTDQLPDMVKDFLRNHLFDLLINTLASLPEVIRFLRGLSSRPAEVVGDVSGPDPEPLALVNGYVELDAETAKLVARAAGIVA